MNRSDSITVDGNEAAASVAFRLSEVIAIYPITPASPMGELADEWASAARPNLWGAVPRVVQMQSEAGAAGAVHGALQAGALATTFTASQGLLLMIPNLYKIAGELTPFCLHVAARAIATHALSIFGDHSDVMACRATGFAMLASSSVQEAQDLAAVAHAASLRSRVPFLHFFDGFRTSHEVAKIEPLSDDALRALLDPDALAAHHRRGLTPDRPVLRGTTHNPDTFFQAREAANPFYDACPAIVHETMERFAALTGRRYAPFEYHGHPEAERVIVAMGSGAETVDETVDALAARGERVGALRVRLFRPLDGAALVAALPPTTRAIGVLDRTKEPGAPGEPLYLDVVAALAEDRAAGAPRFASEPRVLGGRYGLSSKELTPAMVEAIFDNLAAEAPRNHFTIGIRDDVTYRSLPWDEDADREPDDVVRAVLYGLGSDGTVGISKSAIKLVGDETDRFVQGYFVYDSKKSGAVTVSHLRFSPRPIRSAYLVRHANFVACHQPQILEQRDVLDVAKPGSTFLLNTPHTGERAWNALPREVQQQIVDKRLRFWAVDGFGVAREAGLGRRISSAMGACFFALAGILPRDEAIDLVRASVEKSYGKRGVEVVRRNLAAVDLALERLAEIGVPGAPTSTRTRRPPVPADAPDFVRRVTATLLAGKGELLPVSAFPVDGTWPLGTAQYEKREVGLEIPVWDPAICIQCNKCALHCPHATIRTKVYEQGRLAAAPEGFVSTDFRGQEAGAPPAGGSWRYTVQVAPDDCTGCGLCVAVCPAKDKTNPRHKAIDMQPVAPHRERERRSWDFFLSLPEPPRTHVRRDVKGSQLLEPLFEFSGACAGCGETPYLKLLTQLFGDRLMVANATGCSSIYGGNLPTTPWRTNADGRGPAWANSLFEDNAEFGMGMRLALDARAAAAAGLLRELAPQVGESLADAILEARQDDEAAIAEQRELVRALRHRLAERADPRSRRLAEIADDLVAKSVWIVGGDGWAYDIGFGGVDHALASTLDVNILVLDTEVYSNTGGQQSKATPLGAVAKFAANGKEVGKKDLGLLAMTYGHAYVASIAIGARDLQAVRVLEEAASHRGPSLVIAYSHCIAHGYDLAQGAHQQQLAVASGVWPLYRFDPRRLDAGEPPLVVDSGAPTAHVREYMRNEGRFRAVALRDPKRYARLVEAAARQARERRDLYEQLARVRIAGAAAAASGPVAGSPGAAAGATRPAGDERLEGDR